MTTPGIDRQLFRDRVAVVTGAGGGIGFEIARSLAAHGAAVLLNDLDSSRAQSAAASLVDGGGRSVGVGGDLGQPGVAESLVESAVGHFGRLDVAVANAGITLWSPFLDVARDDFDHLLSVNLAGSFFLAQSAARAMREQGDGGRVLFVSSVAGHRSLENLSAYGMTKAGLEGLSRVLVTELSPHGITVNCVAPGSTLTPRNLREQATYEDDWAAVTPLGRAAAAEEIAQAALFLVSPHSGHITGQTVVVDGGWTAISPPPPETDSP